MKATLAGMGAMLSFYILAGLFMDTSGPATFVSGVVIAVLVARYTARRKA